MDTLRYSGRSLVVPIASARATGPAFESFFFSFFILSTNETENRGKILKSRFSKNLY